MRVYIRSRWHAGADVAVCTIEKASALLNRLLEAALQAVATNDAVTRRLSDCHRKTSFSATSASLLGCSHEDSIGESL